MYLCFRIYLVCIHREIKKGFFPQSIQFVELDRENKETDKLNEDVEEKRGGGQVKDSWSGRERENLHEIERGVN